MLFLCIYQWLVRVAQWTSAHEAFCMAALTLGLVVCSVVSCYIAVKGIQATRRLEEEKNRPYIVFGTVVNIPFFGVRMENVGYTPAYNITVKSTPPIWLFGVSDPKYRNRPIAFMNSTMPYLAPRGMMETDLGNLDSIRRANMSMRFEVEVSYEDSRRVVYRDRVLLDYSFFDDLMYSGKKTMHNLVEEVSKTRTQIERIANGQGKPHALIEGFQAYLKRDQEWLDNVTGRENNHKLG